MSFLLELLEFLRVRKKFWLLPIMIMLVVIADHDHVGGVWRLDRVEPGLRSGAVHLYLVLV